MATRAKTAVRKKLAEYRHKRDFSKTAEPSGNESGSRSKKKLVFVIQKHAASHLHFDFRLELDGVMKSWAVPKGPSYDPSVKRLAMQVEDHPIDYNTFEGTIPKGEYGGGTVMLWDRGTYTSALDENDPIPELHRGYAKGDLKILMHGKRMLGSWVLVRTRRGSDEKPQWLLIKHRDEFSKPGADIVAKEMTSVVSGRTMEEIAENKRRKVWHSNRAAKASSARDDAEDEPEPKPVRATKKIAAPSTAARAASAKALGAGALDPMLASVGTDIPAGSDWTFEPKYDGIRVLAYATPEAARLVTRNGKDKTAQFPAVAEAVRKLASRGRRAVVLDGEIVALDHGKPARFQELQQRMHVKDTSAIAGYEKSAPVALMAFDILLDGNDVLVHEPWTKRRATLEKRLAKHASSELRLTESIVDDGREMLDRARKSGWEGIIAKRVDAPYQPGARSRDWLKLKLEFRQEFVVGGFTEPRNTRQHIGALLLGYYDRGRLIYAGNMGGGFDNAGLAEMYEMLAPHERKSSPFEETPRPREPVHWVTPRVVVEVKFNEWTSDGKLRQPIYVGTRDDKDPRTVKREHTSVQESTGAAKKKSAPAKKVAPAKKAPAKKLVRAKVRTSVAATAKKSAPPRKSAPAKKSSARSASSAQSGSVEQQLSAIEQDRGDGDIEIKRGVALHVSSLGKIYFPGDNYTKGDLMRYYARVAPLILPTIADRPLVLKRTPEGIKGEVFFQQKPPQHVPKVVRVETVENDDGVRAERIVGGDLATLLYTVQIGCVSVDPWASRIDALDSMDYTILDLDPGPRATFERVVEVARWVKEELDASGLRAALKTSGSRGLHIAIPLPPRTPYEAGLLLAQLIATRVAEAHPKEATVERSVKSRPPSAVYVDYLQNVKGKSVAGAYCVRARDGATVSTPLQWKELNASLDLREFTIETVPPRIVKLGDIWGSALKTKNTGAAIRAAADR
ncbi:MAG TPA: DNA ligase D [Gemmatimonadaceae bacterium]|jgi:bifunctional non-homologous end joining protein LigD|nr:DNA ligase D [Gemmatimonadaceae bacterium]